MYAIDFVFTVIGTPVRWTRVTNLLGITEGLVWLFDDEEDEDEEFSPTS
jgi:hypothetical protein